MSNTAQDALFEQFDVRVFGDPQTQGSKKAFMPPGAKHPIIVEDNQKLKPWRLRMLNTFRMRLNKLKMAPPRWDCPIEATLVVILPRLKSLPVNRIVLPTTGLDLDKLQRAVGDSLKDAGVLVDDSRICRWIATKRYAIIGEESGIELTVRPIVE